MVNRRILCAVVLTALVAAGCKPDKNNQKGEGTMTLKVTSHAFEHNGMIPSKYTADGADVSPPVAWQGVPENAQSIAVICDDPDAPMGTWVHWLIWNIPANSDGLDENVPSDAVLEDGICQGTTDFGQIGYGGPAPPSGVHRYFFKVYALDTMLNLSADSVKPELEAAMKGHILAKGELVGKYTRKR